MISASARAVWHFRLMRNAFLVQQRGKQFEVSMEVVPTKVGWPRLRQSRISSNTASNFSCGVKHQSPMSLRTIRRWVGTTMTSKTVNLLEFEGFGIGGAGHASQFLVQAEVVLEGDRGQRLIFGLNRHPSFGLDGLVQDRPTNGVRAWCDR